MKSNELFSQAKACIPGGVSSPVRSFKHVGGEPVFFERAQGARLFDVDGRSFVDFCLSFGPHLLGHGHPDVVSAIREQAGRGTSFGACHAGEAELVRRMLAAYPFLDQARLVNSGTEACMTALRIARGYTGRAKILKFEGCYHGHSDGLLAKAGSGVAHLAESDSAGVPPGAVGDTVIARLDRLDSVREAFRLLGSQIAAVILEPVPANWGLWIPTREHLQAIVAIARENGSLVIFDEVISGFRVGPSGACGRFDLQPDLVTLGKIVGGGLPLAAVLGKGAVMSRLAPEGDVYQAGTLSGNALSVAAGKAVLDRLAAEPPYAALEFTTTAFVAGLHRIAEKFGATEARSFSSIFWLGFSPRTQAFPPPVTPDGAAAYARFFRHALDRGVYLPPSPYEVGFLSTAHTTEVLDGVLAALEKD